MEDDKVTPEIKIQIDSMEHYEMCKVWRFSPSGDPRLTGAAGLYFQERLFKHFGGFTPEISKSLGWTQ